MTSKQYWEGEPYLTKAFREAETFRLQLENQKAWISGLYVLNAIGAAFSKENKYPQKPYDELAPLSAAQKAEKRKRDESDFIAALDAWADNINLMRKEE